MIKKILNEYVDLKEEAKDSRRRIVALEQQIRTIEEEGPVVDIVKGGRGGMKTYRIEGFPYPDYNRKKSLLTVRRARLEEIEFELLEKINEVEMFINELEDARIRRILKFRFLDNLSWVQVAFKMGGYHTEDSCRKSVERFLKTNICLTDLSNQKNL